MKFTSEDLMKAMGLKIGDKIKIDLGYTFEIVQNGKIISLERLGEGYYTDLEFLVDTDFDILPRPKRVGDLKCEEYICDECPLRYTRCEQYLYDEVILYDILEGVNSDYKDQEIYDILKARLDKEVLKDDENI